MNQKMRGIWIPADVWFLFLKKEIGATELHLLAAIDSLVTPEKGCFASNKYLGELLGVRSDYIARLIGKLKTKGLLQQIKFDGRRRYLETVWSRIKDLDRNTKADLDNGPTLLSPLGKVKQKDDSSGFELDLKDPKHEPFDKSSAIQFKTTTKRSKSKLPKTWPDYFRLLRTKDKKSKEQIENVLDWYCENYQNKWTPKCYTPKIFREKFDRVVAAMERTQDKTENVKISAKAKKVLERLGTRQWPKGSEAQLPVCVQTSLDQYEWFRNEVIQKANDLYPDKETDSQDRMRVTRQKNLLNYLISVLPAPSHFVQNWFQEIWDQINTWDAWNGNLERMSFQIDGKKFKGYVIGLVVSFGRNSNEANQLLKGFKK